MKIVSYLALAPVFASLCCSALPQRGRSCQADIQNLKLPSRAFIDGVMGENTPPVSLLFSRGGIDVYSATDFRAIKALSDGGVSTPDEAVTVIEVYQDERARQGAIQWFQDKGIGRASIQNVKFGVFQLMLTPVWTNDVLERKWMISGYSYYEPYSCVPPTKRGASAWDVSELCAATDYCPNEIYGISPPGGLPLKLRILPRGPNLLKAIDLIRSKLAAHDLPN